MNARQSTKLPKAEASFLSPFPKPCLHGPHGSRLASTTQGGLNWERLKDFDRFRGNPPIEFKAVKLRQPPQLHKGNAPLRDHRVERMGRQAGIVGHLLNVQQTARH